MRTVVVRYAANAGVRFPEEWIETWPVFRYRPPFYYNGKSLLPFLWVANDNGGADAERP